MNRLGSCTLVAFIYCLAMPYAYAIETLRWERLPLAVPLVVDQERIIFVDRNIRVGLPTSLNDRLRVQSTGGAIYLRANAPIEPTRLQLQDTDSGTVLLIDIVAESAQENQVPLEPVRIVEHVTAAQPNDELNKSIEKNDASSSTQHTTPIPVALTRYAAQSLYAPLRTIEPVPGIIQTPLPRNLILNTLIPTQPIQAKALAAWRLSNFWVSAIHLRNTSSHWLELDPRLLQGKFITATFQHPNLGPSDTPEDTTVLYLVTYGHNLPQALLPAINAVNAAQNFDPSNIPAVIKGGSHAQ